MKPEKLALWIINFLLSALLVLAALVLLERIPSQAWPWYSRSLCCAPLLICFPAGLFCAKRSKGLRLAVMIPVILIILSADLLTLAFVVSPTASSVSL